MEIFKDLRKDQRTFQLEILFDTETNSLATLVSPPLAGRDTLNDPEPDFELQSYRLPEFQNFNFWRSTRPLTSSHQLPNCLIEVSSAEAVVGSGAWILIRLTLKCGGQRGQDADSATFSTTKHTLRIECHKDNKSTSGFVQVPFIEDVHNNLKVAERLIFFFISKQTSNVVAILRFRPSLTDIYIKVQNNLNNLSGCNCAGSVHLMVTPGAGSIHVVTPPGGEKEVIRTPARKVACGGLVPLLHGAVHVEVAGHVGLVQKIAKVIFEHTLEEIFPGPEETKLLHQPRDVQISLQTELDGRITQITEGRCHAVLGVNHDGDVLANVEVLQGVLSVRAAGAAEGTIRVDLEVAVGLTSNRERRDTWCWREQPPGAGTTNITRGSAGVMIMLRRGRHDWGGSSSCYDLGTGSNTFNHIPISSNFSFSSMDSLESIHTIPIMTPGRTAYGDISIIITTDPQTRRSWRLRVQPEQMESLELYTIENSRNLPTHIRCNSPLLISPAPLDGEPAVVLTITGAPVCTDKR